MAKQSSLIKELDITKKNCTLTARATRIWEVKYSSEHLTPDSMDMILVDEQGDQIQAVVRKDLIKHFKEAMQEGFIYTLSHFIVGNKKRGYKQCLNNNIIWFTPYTSVIPTNETAVTISHHRFNLFPLSRLGDRVNNNAILTEVIGQLIGIENKIDGATASSDRRTIHIRDDKGDTIRATLWGDKVDLVPGEILNPLQPKIIIITATRVSVYSGNYQLNSTNETKVYIDLNVPEVHAFKQAIMTIPPKVISQIQVAQPETLKESMTKNRKTIRELQELQMTNEDDKDLNASYTCVGRIDMVLEDEWGWRYRSCNVCKSKIDDTEYCNKCEFNPPFPIDRYRLVVTLHDGNATLNVGLFDKDVEKVVGKPMAAMDKLRKQVDKGSNMDLEADMALAIERSLREEYTGASKKRTTSQMDALQSKSGQSSHETAQGKKESNDEPTDSPYQHKLEDHAQTHTREGKEKESKKHTSKISADKKPRVLSKETPPPPPMPENIQIRKASCNEAPSIAYEKRRQYG